MSKKNEATKYSSGVLAAIIIIAMAVGTFMYTLLTRDKMNDPEKMVNGIDVEIVDDGVNPGGNSAPTHAPDPNVVPTTPPPTIPEMPTDV